MDKAESEGSVLKDIILHLDRDLKITWVNQDPTNEAAGCIDAAIGMTCAEFLGHPQESCADCPAKKVIETGQVQSAVIPTGSGKYHQSRAYPIKERDGQVTGAVLVFATDASPMAGTATERGDLDYFAIDDYPFAITIVDPETYQHKRFNDTALKLFGYTAEEFRNLSVLDIDVKHNRESFKVLGEKILRDGQVEIETVIRTAKGVLKDCFIKANVISLRGKPLIYVVSEDISDRKKAERVLHESESLYRSLVENSPDIILEVDPEGTILYSNRILKGIRSQDTYGSNLLSYMPRAQHKKIRQLMGRSLSRRRNTSFEVSVVTPAGMRWWSTRVIPLEKGGRINRFLLIITDVTEGKRAQEALRLSEERYRNLVENSPLPVFVCTGETIRYLNPMGIRLLGATSRIELLDHPFTDFLHPDDRESAIAELFKVSEAQGQAAKGEFRIVKLTGETLHVVASSINVMYEGELRRLLTMNDITDREKAEEALRASEWKYRYLTENMRDAVWMMDLNWQHSYISPSITKIRGFTVEEIMSLPIEKNLPPESLENANRLLGPAIASGGVDENGKPLSTTFEQLEYRKDGTTVWTEVQATLILDDDRKPVGMMGITRDISERKQGENALRQSEEQYRSLVEKSPIPILIHRRGDILYMNAKCLENVGLTSFDGVRGKSLLNFVHPGDVEFITKRLRKSIDEDVDIVKFIFRTIGQDGRTGAFDATSMKVIFEGEPCRMVVAHQIPMDSVDWENRI